MDADKAYACCTTHPRVRLGQLGLCESPANLQMRQQNLVKEMVDWVGEIIDQLWHLEPPIVTL